MFESCAVKSFSFEIAKLTESVANIQPVYENQRKVSALLVSESARISLWKLLGLF